MSLLALAALLAFAAYAARQSHGTTPGTPGPVSLDPNLPAAIRAVVLQALKSEKDTKKLRLLEATLPGYPKTQAALEAQAKLLDGLVQKNADKITTLLAAIRDPSWRDKVQGFLQTVSDLLSLEILAAALSVGEPSAAAVLRLKIAALKGQPDYVPPKPPRAVDDGKVLNVYVTGQYQGCDEQPTCVPSAAKLGTGTGPLGLDVGLAGLSPEAQQCLSWLLVTLPSGFAKAYRAAPNVQADPAGCLAQTLTAVDAVLRQKLPMTATSLRLKAKFLLANKGVLNLAAQAALASSAHTGGIPEIVGQAADWLRAQSPDHGYHAGGLHVEDNMGGLHVEDNMGAWIEDHMGQTLTERGRSRRMHAGQTLTERRSLRATAPEIRRVMTGAGPEIVGVGAGPEIVGYRPARVPSIHTGQFLPVSQEGYSDFGWSAEDLPNSPTGYGWSSEDTAPFLGGGQQGPLPPWL